MLQFVVALHVGVCRAYVVTATADFTTRNTGKLDCQPGHFCAGGSAPAKKCPVGQYQDQAHQPSCKVCKDPSNKLGRTMCESDSPADSNSKSKKDLLVGAVAGGLVGVVIVALLILVVRGCKREATFSPLMNTVSSCRWPRGTLVAGMRASLANQCA